MKSITNRILLTFVTILGMGQLSQAMEDDRSQPASYAVGSVGYGTISPNIDSQRPASDMSVPDNTNTCGFLCGRCQFMYYDGNHPNQDCCTFYSKYDGKGERTSGGNSACCASFIAYNGILNACGGLAVTLTGLAMSCNHSITCPNLIFFSPLIATASCSGVMCAHGCIGCTAYNCANSMKKTQFTESYKRGQLCLPGDTCSTTSWKNAFWNCWNPCCGESKDA